MDQFLMDKMFDKNENEDCELDEEILKTLGTNEQTQIITNYPTNQISEKLMVPYIEKMNGNICIKSVDDDDSKYRVAVSFYNKALLGLKMIFEGG